MANGVPCVTYPRFSDQVVNSALICWLGMGECVPETLNSDERDGCPDDMLSTVKQAMSGGDYKKEAIQVKKRVTEGFMNVEQ
jgi:UDP:flavonoid glycosyltransferase YjiC (YdhE family)